MHWRRKWQPSPVFLPGESQGRGSLVGCRLWGRTESDTTAATQQQQRREQRSLKFFFIFLLSLGDSHRSAECAQVPVRLDVQLTADASPLVGRARSKSNRLCSPGGRVGCLRLVSARWGMGLGPRMAGSRAWGCQY